MSLRPVGAAIIGFGGVAQYHHQRWLRELPEFDLRGVWDINPAKLVKAQQDGIAVYRSEAELLADPAVELVVIAVPNDDHLPVSLRAMQAGKHVLCEKPVTLNSAELETALAAARQAGVIFTVDQNRRWDGDFVTVRKAIEEGCLGDVYQIESRVYGSRGIPGDWRQKKARGGGMVLDWGIHLFDQAMLLAQTRRLTSVFAAFEYAWGGECEDGFLARFTYEGGLTCLAEVRTNNYIPMPRWYVSGSAGTLLLRDWDDDAAVVRIKCEDADALPVAAASGVTKTMAPRSAGTIEQLCLPHRTPDVGDLFRHLYKAIRGLGPVDITGDQLRTTMRMTEAVFRSAQENRVITDI